MTASRHYTASALVLGLDGRLLKIHHVKSGVWLPPGGHIEPGETPAEAALREVREETGLNAQIVTGPVFRHPAVISHVPPFTIVEMTATDPVNGPHQHIDFAYVCRAADSDRLQPDAGEVAAARWVALAALSSLFVSAELSKLAAHALAWATDGSQSGELFRDG
jgi:8-oxo-dGTP pyrophosphatase MutT (NUDIX family)